MAMAALSLSAAQLAFAASPGAFHISALSNRPDKISGGDVLIGVEFPILSRQRTSSSNSTGRMSLRCCILARILMR